MFPPHDAQQHESWVAQHRTMMAGIIAGCQQAKDKPPVRVDIRTPFGDGEYRFALPRKEAEELERTCGFTDAKGVRQSVGIMAIFGRLARGRAFLSDGTIDWANLGVAEALAGDVIERDVREVIRLGLIGGGEAVIDDEPVKVSPERAKQLVELYVDGRPLEEMWTLAFAILGARIMGRAPDPDTGL